MESIDIFHQMLNAPRPELLIVTLDGALPPPASLSAPPSSTCPFPPVQFPYPLHSYAVSGSEKPDDLWNVFPSVDSYCVCRPAFSDVWLTQRHRTAHLSQTQASLSKHIPGLISQYALGCCCPFTEHPRKSQAVRLSGRVTGGILF